MYYPDESHYATHAPSCQTHVPYGYEAHVVHYSEAVRVSAQFTMHTNISMPYSCSNKVKAVAKKNKGGCKELVQQIMKHE